jgi:putative transposase
MNELTRQKIIKTLKETKDRRKSQKCIVRTVKVDESQLNKKEKEQLKMFFIEAKWLYNNILASEDPFHYDYKNTVVTVLNKDRQPEQKQLKFLPIIVQYQLIKSTKQNFISLLKSKNKGNKVGKLKYESEHSCINFYDFSRNIRGKNRVKLSGIKRHLVVRGLKQILNHYEIANALLLKKPSGYYLAITCYELITTNNNLLVSTPREVGIDFGIRNNLTTSEAEVYNVRIEESERLKRLQQKFSRQTMKGSNNRHKTKLLIRKEYEKISNQKNDAANKIIHKLFVLYDFVYIQDENLKNWHLDKRFSQTVQYSCMGTIKSKLAKNSSRVKVVSKWFPSTKLCYICNRINDIGSNRTYRCECGLVEDRDVKAAKTILLFGKEQISYSIPVTKFKEIEDVRVPMESREFKSVEKTQSFSLKQKVK